VGRSIVARTVSLGPGRAYGIEREAEGITRDQVRTPARRAESH